MIFVDTGAWFAAVVVSDSNHASASDWLLQNQQSLLTADYVLSETLTLLRARGERHKGIELGNALFSDELAVLHYMTADEILQTWQVFQRFADKDWSFTDCASKVVMEKLGITQAFAFDHHFRQFSTIEVLP